MTTSPHYQHLVGLIRHIILLYCYQVTAMDKLVRKYKVLFSKGKRQSRHSTDLSDRVTDFIKSSKEENVSFAQLGSLQSTKSLSLEENDTNVQKRIRKSASVRSCPDGSNICGLTDDLDDATADMMAMFRSKREDSESSSSRSSIKSKYSIQFETDNSDGEEEDGDNQEGLRLEEELYRDFVRHERLSISISQKDESSRYFSAFC